MNVIIAHYLSFKDIEKDEDMLYYIHVYMWYMFLRVEQVHMSRYQLNIMEVDRIHIQMISLDLIHIMCGDVSNIPNAKLTSTTLWMLDTLRILNYNYTRSKR